jgi:hypothetical protein
MTVSDASDCRAKQSRILPTELAKLAIATFIKQWTTLNVRNGESEKSIIKHNVFRPLTNDPHIAVNHTEQLCRTEIPQRLPPLP